MGDDALPLCKYGEKCFRKNPQHFKDYSHPHLASRLEGASSHKRPVTGTIDVSGSKKPRNTSIYTDNEISNPKTSEKVPSKASTSTQQREEDVEMSPVVQLALTQKSTKYSYYMSYVHRGIDRSYNQGSALTLSNVLNGTRATLERSCLFSYMYDIEWIRQQYKPADRDKPMTLVEGLKGDSRIDLLEQRSGHNNIKMAQAKLDIMYGVHHTKMIILKYDTGIRIMITTANLIPMDWFQKSQALWCSPLCPPGEGDSETGFKADLMEYLKSYKSKLLDEWVDVIARHNMTKCRVFLIASIPGRHIGERKSAFGHLKLRKVLRQHGPGIEAAKWPVIGQFSSIGSLGSAPSWLKGEFLTSLSSLRGSVTAGNPQGKDAIKLVYPTVENVRRSLEGYQAGGSLPFREQTYLNQSYITSIMHQWKSDCRGRSLASPHIKSYLRLSPDNKKVPWFLMTSSNLSKAAWGALEKQESQLMIRSYELGVLFLPKMYDLDTFSYDPSFAEENAFPVPFDLPLTPYTETDEIWLVDKRYNTKRDSVGDYWDPSR